jgi:subtilisin family serine protease
MVPFAQADWGHSRGDLKMLKLNAAAVRVLGTAFIAGLGVLLVSCYSTTSGPPPAQAVAASEPQSYIVEGRSTELAPRAVTAPGGEVTSRLNIIDAVEARLTDAQHAAVLADAGVKQISVNALVSTNAAASVRDNFELDSFANNDGTHRWYGNWIEQADDNNPNGGFIVLGWNDRGGKRLILTGRGSSIYRRAATPGNASSVTLKFKSLRAGLEFGEYAAVQASGNGGASWTEVGRISGPANDGSFTSQTYDITAFRGRDTAIRFVPSMSGRYGDDHIDIDDVEISYNTTFGEGDPVPVDVNARDLHQLNIRGRDIGVAVIDTGYWKVDSLDKDSLGNGRVAAQYDAVRNTVDAQWSSVSTDTNGHGTHITGLIASSRKDGSGRYFGVAPRRAHHFHQGLR